MAYAAMQVSEQSALSAPRPCPLGTRPAQDEVHTWLANFPCPALAPGARPGVSALSECVPGVLMMHIVCAQRMLLYLEFKQAQDHLVEALQALLCVRAGGAESGVLEVPRGRGPPRGSPQRGPGKGLGLGWGSVQGIDGSGPDLVAEAVALGRRRPRLGSGRCSARSCRRRC